MDDRRSQSAADTGMSDINSEILFCVKDLNKVYVRKPLLFTVTLSFKAEPLRRMSIKLSFYSTS